MSEHLGDDAELYALGMLEPARRAEIDVHAGHCAACLRSLGEAEETAAALAGLLPRATPSALLTARFARPQWGREARTAWLAGFALAAALVLALGTAWYQNGVLRGRLEAERIATVTLVHSHFLHATMTTTPAGGTLAAKVVYARDGSWLYVLVDEPEGAIDVRARIGGKPWTGGRATPNGATAALLVHPPGRPEAIDLLRGGVVVAEARLAY